MAGLIQACPGHPRLGCCTKDVDARDKPWEKPAHDGQVVVSARCGWRVILRLHALE